jgi:NAD+ synthase
MPDTLKITLAQLNQSVGDVAWNAKTVIEARGRAADSHLLVFPELHLIGYPPEDLVLKPSLVERAAAELQGLAELTGQEGPAMLVGSAFVLDGALHNGVALLDQGKVAAIRLKHELPGYGTFDETRLFQPGPLPEPVIVRGTMIGVPIGEDIWRPEICRHLANFGAELFVCINGSPYETDKDTLRIEGVAKRRAVDTGLPLAYLNRVGGQDELVFDGASFVINSDGALAVQMKDWEVQQLATNWTKTAQGWRCDRSTIEPLAAHLEDQWSAMVLALRDFVERGGFSGITLGLSGGLDSAVCAAIAVDAIGAGNVQAVSFGAGSARAGACADALGIRYRESDISPVLEAFSVLSEIDEGQGSGARLSGAVLSAMAAGSGHLLVAAMNKTALAVGASPACGGYEGGYNPLRDAYETSVRSLARWRNGNVARIGRGPRSVLIPPAILDDAESGVAGSPGPDGLPLPACDLLDAILSGLVEHDRSVSQLVSEGSERGVAARVEFLLHAAEGLRRQAPLGTKLTGRNFGRDRRYPICHAYRSA